MPPGGEGDLVPALPAIAEDRLTVVAPEAERADAHQPEDLLTPDIRRKVAVGAGLSPSEVDELLITNPLKLLHKLGFSESLLPV